MKSRVVLLTVSLFACSPVSKAPTTPPATAPTTTPAAPSEDASSETSPPDKGPAPTIANVVPAPGQMGVATNATIVLVLSEPIAKTSVTADTLLVTGGASGLVTGAIDVNARTITFKPTAALQTNTSFTVVATTGITSEKGAALASAFTFTFTTGDSADTTAPVLSASSPAAGASGVATNTQVTFVFSEPISPASANGTSVTCLNVPGIVATQGSTVIFKPDSGFAAGTTVTCVVTTAVTDTAGNALATAYTLTFVTGAGADTTAPTVTATSPTDTSTNVSVSATLSVTFSEPIDPATMSAATFTLSDGKTSIAGAVSAQGTAATFKPVQALQPTTVYTATIAATVKDLAGNSLVAPYGFVFTTSGGADTTPPTVLSVSPLNNATGVATNTAIVATLSEPIDPSTVSALTVTLSQGASVVSASVQASGATITITPAAALATAKKYTVELAAAIADQSGNKLGAPYTWAFTTGATADTTPPTLTQSAPASGATNVAPPATITLTFSEAIEPGTVTTSSITLSAGSPLAITLAQPQPNTVVVTPAAPLQYATSYTITLSGPTDLAGNALAATQVTFATRAQATSWPGTLHVGNAGDVARAIAVDASGNIFIAFDTSAAFAGNPLGGSDCVLVKMDRYGNTLWSRRYGSTGDDTVADMVVDGVGDVYLFGMVSNAWEGTIPTVFSQLTLTKYSAAGSQLFYREFGGWGGNDTPGGMAIDASGLIYLAASTDYIISIWDTNQGARDLSIYKYNSAGERQWAEQLGSTGDDVGRCMAVSPAGTVYVSGTTTGALFGKTPLGGSDGFVATLNPSSGSVTWSSLVGTNADETHACVEASSTRFFVFGGTKGAFAAAADTNGDAFAIAYQTNGTEAWRTQLKSNGGEVAARAVASGNDVYLAGTTGGRLTPGSASGRDAFLARAAAATPAFVSQYGGGDDEYGADAAAALGGDLLLYGDDATGVFVAAYDSSGQLR